MHVVDPIQFPLDPAAKYKPHPHTLEDATAFYNQLGIENMVFVQPSIYGNDNSCMLEALRAITPRHGRAVVTFDPTEIDESQLRKWHEIGVRGVRVNFISVGREVTDAELRQELEQYANVIRPLDWVLQLFVPLTLLPSVQKVVPGLGVKVCIDHFGYPSLPEPFNSSKPINPHDLVGFDHLLELLQVNTWVKLSAPYRLSKDANMRDLDPLGQVLVKEAPDRIVYAADWPHTRFENVDSVPFIEACYRWCGGDATRTEKLFRINAEHLWDVR